MKVGYQIVFCLVTLLMAHSAKAVRLSGKVTDANGEALPYVNVYVENTSYGVVTNLKGWYFIELKPGNYNIVYSILGYQQKVVEVRIEDKDIIKNVSLVEGDIELGLITVTANGKDPAYGIIEKVIQHKHQYKSQFESLKADLYLKASLEKETQLKEKDSLTGVVTDTIAKEGMNLIESYATLYYKSPSTYKEHRIAYRDMMDRKINQFSGSVTLRLGMDGGYGETDPYSQAQEGTNPYLFYLSPTDADFNFYENLIDLPTIGQVPYVSPISITALASYKYKLIESFREDGFLVHKIEVIPRRKGGNFFSGHLYIIDDLWCIKTVDLSIDPLSMDFFKEFRLMQNYTLVDDSFWIVNREEFFYSTSDGAKTMVFGNTVVLYSNFEVNISLEKRVFKNELISYEADAYEKDSAFWEGKRPIKLKVQEQSYIQRQDSIHTWQISPMRMMEYDSSYNAISIWDFLFSGVGFRNSFKKREIYFGSIFNGVNILGVGGYRHAVLGSYVKEFTRGNRISLAGTLDYGFQNKDVKGRAEVKYRYDPKHFGEVGLKFGNEYQMINTFQSFTAILSRGNYVQAKSVGVHYGREIVNGLFFAGDVDYVDQTAITGLKLSSWSDSLFGELNVPQDFEPFQKLVFDLRFNIRFAQKYYTTPYKKVVTGTKYPKLRVRLKVGVPDVVGSDVDYGFVEVKLWDKVQIGTLGQSRYEVLTGSFFRSKDYPFTENKFFRGSDVGFFASPLSSFQLFAPEGLNTNRPYFEGHYIHNFQGAFMNKIPMIKKWRLSTMAGAGILLIEEANLSHAEIFVGLEKQFRIRKQMIKIGGYYILADSNQDVASSTFKIGIDFYNTFNRSWSY